jgi:hypothetical protein
MQNTSFDCRPVSPETSPTKVLIKTMLSDTKIEQPDGVRRFDIEKESFSTNLAIPPINPLNSMKNRIGLLEDIASTQIMTNKISYNMFTALDDDSCNNTLLLKQLIQDMQNNFDNNIKEMKKDYDYRFELQSIENKRLQEKFAVVKSDLNQTMRKLGVALSRLQKLELEVFDEDPVLEGNSLDFMSMSINDSLDGTRRPHTTAL